MSQEEYHECVRGPVCEQAENLDGCDHGSCDDIVNSSCEACLGIPVGPATSGELKLLNGMTEEDLVAMLLNMKEGETIFLVEAPEDQN